MSTYGYSPRPETPSHVLKPRSYGWGWPRLVDVPKAIRPSPTRATSVQSYAGVMHSTDSGLEITRTRRRASSLKSCHIPSIVVTEHCQHSQHSISELIEPANITSETAPEAPEDTEAPDTVEAPYTVEAPDAVESPDATAVPEAAPVLFADKPEANPPIEPHPGLETARPPLLESFQTPEATVEASAAESESPMSPALSEYLARKESTPFVTLLLAEICQKPANEPEKNESNLGLISSPRTMNSPVSESTQASNHDGDLDSVVADVSFAPLQPASLSGSKGSESLESSPLPQESPRRVSVFRELLSEADSVAIGGPSISDSDLPLTRIEMPEPFDIGKLPRPKIVIIRATEDRSENTFAIPVDPKLIEEVHFVPQTRKATLPSHSPLIERISGGIPMPETRLSKSSRNSTGLAPDDFGTVTNVNVSQPRHVRRRSKALRKARKKVLRSPVLAVILGRQLAVVTLPALKIIADGGDPGLTRVREANGTMKGSTLADASFSA